MTDRIRQAHFTRSPRFLGEVVRDASSEALSTYLIEKTIILPEEDFLNFITDMTVERPFLKKNHLLCRIDDEGIWHCLLVKPRGHKEGVLVLAEENGLPISIALFFE